MSKTIYTSKAFQLTEFCGKNGKPCLQITQGADYVQLTKAEVCRLIDKLKEWVWKE